MTNNLSMDDRGFCCPVLNILVFVALAIGLNSNALAQRGDAPSIGDIIEYHFQNQNGYGLVVGFRSRAAMTLEVADGSGGFEEKMVILSPILKWRVVDGAKASPADVERAWASSDGKFKINAKMIGVEGSDVRLEKPDGAIISVPTSKLSPSDRSFVKKHQDSLTSGDGDLPEDVLLLRKRREGLMEVAGRHDRLAKLNPNLMVGDIIQYNDFFDGQTYAIISSLGIKGQLEKVSNGELESESLNGVREWRFYDREFVAQPVDSRTWNSASGAFSVKATLKSVDGEKVEIENSDGGTITVELAKLSKVDQNYVRRMKGKLNVKNDPQLAAERANYGSDLQMLLARRDELMERESANLISAKAASKMQTISLKTQPLDLPAERLKPYAIKSESKSAMVSVRVAEDSRLESICLARDADVVAFTAYNPFEGLPTLGVIDLSSSESVTNVDSDNVGRDAKVVAISPSAQTLIVYSGEGFNHELELWKYTNGQLLKNSMITYDSFREPKAHLFSDTEGVIQSSDGNLVFFDVGERILPTHHIPAGRMARNNSFEVTDDEKSIVYFDAKGPGVSVIDVETKKSVGGVMFERSSGEGIGSMAKLNMDGQTITYAGPNGLSIYDLTTGKQVAKHQLPKTAIATSSVSGGIKMLSKDLLLVNERSIFDLRLGLDVGSIESNFGMNAKYFGNATRLSGEIEDGMGNAGRGGFGGMIGGASRDWSSMLDEKTNYVNSQANVSIERLPVPQIVAFTNSLTKDDIVKFGDGKSVQLVFNIQNNRGLEDQIRAKVTAIMNENNVEVVDQSDFVMEFAYRVGTPQTETYRIIGGPNNGKRTVNFTPKTCSATLQFQGNTIWSRSASASLGRPFSEEELNRNIANGNNVTPELLLKYDYPNEIRVLDPRKKREFRWD